MKNKLLVLTFLLLLFLTTKTYCDESLKLVVNTVPVTYSDAYPFIENGRTMVPLRILSENMQADISYNEQDETITIRRDGNCITKATYGTSEWTYIEYNGKKYENAVAVCIFTNNSPDVTVELMQGDKVIHSTKTKMDVSTKIINGRTYIPARYIAYALGYGIYYDQPRNRILYQYKANQIADFESKTKYNKEYYYYNDMMFAGRESWANYCSWSYRDGYGNIKIVDGDNGWESYKSGQSKERSHEMAELLYMPVGFTFETEEYAVSSKNSPEENFRIFRDMINNKTNGIMNKDANGAYSLDINTYNELVGISYTNGRYILGPQKIETHLSAVGSPLAGPPHYSRFDYSMYYYIENGQKLYYDTSAKSPVYDNASTYNLLFLRTFLGEIGERIWQMMDDYYMHKGVFDRGEVYVGDSVYTKFNFLDVEILSEHVGNYGFDFVSSVNLSDNYEAYKLLTLKYGDFEFKVRYKRNGLSEPQVGYLVYFENLPF